MSDRLDDRIKELYAELTEAAPDLRPLPSRVPAAPPAPFYARPAVWAGAAAALVVVLGFGLLIRQVDFAGDDDASATTAAPTTAAPTSGAAETTTTVAAPTAAPTTAATTSAPATSSAATTTAPPIDFARDRFLADLDTACTSAAGLMASIADPSTPAEYAAALSTMFDALEEVRVSVESADPILENELLPVADAIMTAQGFVVLGGDEPVDEARYASAVEAIDELAFALGGYGADDCATLGTGLP